MKSTTINISPSHIVLFSFLLLILLGTLLLSLPIASIAPIPLIDLLFTATSAACATGLITIPLIKFTFFGKTIIMILMQIGALGLASMSVLILSLFMELTISTRFMAEQLLEIHSWHTTKKILKFTLLSTLVLELIGTIGSYYIFSHHYSPLHALFYALFHSVSSFTNAGLAFLQFFEQQHLEIYKTNYLFLLITSCLTFFGCLGFLTWHELFIKAKNYLCTFKTQRISLQTKIIVYVTMILIAITFIIFFLLEYNNTLRTLSLPQAIANSMFHAITFKSCGYVLVDLTEFHMATILLIIIISFIGSSPGSTGGGIKITTFALLASIIKSTIKERPTIEIFERSISNEQSYKAITIITLSVTWILFTTFLLLITQKEWSFIEIVFETVSAFTNLGFSLKGTQYLSYLGKVLICATMFIGRIGSLTFILGLKFRKRTETAEFTYPEERIMLG